MNWQHQAIAWTDVDSSSVRSSGIHLRAFDKEYVKVQISKSWQEIISLQSHPDPIEDNELMQLGYVVFEYWMNVFDEVIAIQMSFYFSNFNEIFSQRLI